MRSWVACGFVVLLGAGCSKSGVPDDLAAAVEANRTEQVVFLDSATFDANLSQALRDEPQTVFVDPSKPFSVNDIPDRLDKWLYSVQESGGQVTSVEQEMDPQRGLITEGVDLIMLVVDYVVETRTYSPADQYDATVYHDENGLVRRVTFTKH